MKELYQKNKGLIIFLIVLLSFNLFINAIFFAYNMEINSDNLANFFTYSDIFKSKITFPTDNYLHQMPFYFLAQKIFGYTPLMIYFISVVETLFCFIFFVLFYMRFINDLSQFKKKRNDFIKIVVFFTPLFFLFNLKYIFILLDRPFNRTLSYGLFFLFLFIIFGKKKMSYWWTLFFPIFVIIFFSDPLIIYIIALPLLIAFAAVYLRDKKEKYNLYLAIILFVAIVTSSFLRFLLNRSGYFNIYDSSAGFASLQTIGSNFKTFVEIFLGLFNSFFFGEKLIDKGTILRLANIIVLSFGIYGLFLLLKEGIKKNDAIKIFIPLSFIITAVSYVFSNRPEGFLTIRFISFLPFLFSFGLLIFILKMSRQNNFYLKSFLLFIILVVLGNILAMRTIYHYQPTKNMYKDNFNLVDSLARENLKYGYAEFWDASTNTFFSENKIKIRQVFCNQQKIDPFLWITSDNFYRPETYKGETFLLLDDKLALCSYEKIISQFGMPRNIIEINYDRQAIKVLIFNYNIANRF